MTILLEVFGVLAKRWRLALEIGLCVAVMVANVAGKRAGASKQKVFDQGEAVKAMAVADARYRESETRYAQQVSDVRAKYAGQEGAAKAADARYVSDLRVGSKRLRLPVAAGGCPDAADPRPAAARVDDLPRAELAPEAGAALYGIAADGDEAIRQLTALQAWAKAAVRLCSPPPKTPKSGALHLADF